MTLSDILAMLKANLEIVNSINDTYLTHLITVAMAEITREGITIQVTDDAYAVDDANLIVMYAAYLYRGRATQDSNTYRITQASAGMPKMLRYALNNRLLSEKMQT